MSSRLTLWALVVLSCATPAAAQLASQTALVGTVTDSGGAVVPGAQVVAVNTNTGDTYETTTTAERYYNIQFVRTGTYEITVSVTGFQTFKATGVQVTGNQVVRTDAALKVGGLTESVNVEAKAQLLTTDSATVSETIGKRAIVELPLNGRNFWSLAEHDSRRARGRQQRHRVELQRCRSARDSEQPVAGRHQLLGGSAGVYEYAADCRRGRGSPRISPRVSAPPIV